MFEGRYFREFVAGWGTMDFNSHMANTAYLNLAADIRMAFFADHGFPPTEFRRLGLGPVIRKDELEYFREVGLRETVIVTYAALAMSADGARFVVENEMYLASGERAARFVRRAVGSICASVSSSLRHQRCSRRSRKCLVIPTLPNFRQQGPAKAGHYVRHGPAEAGHYP